jgi:hypothetical protein
MTMDGWEEERYRAEELARFGDQQQAEYDAYMAEQEAYHYAQSALDHCVGTVGFDETERMLARMREAAG